ncbi:MAG: hypothetical protein ACYDBP_04340 [Leptospirales bacterium]
MKNKIREFFKNVDLGRVMEWSKGKGRRLAVVTGVLALVFLFGNRGLVSVQDFLRLRSLKAIPPSQIPALPEAGTVFGPVDRNVEAAYRDFSRLSAVMPIVLVPLETAGIVPAALSHPAGYGIQASSWQLRAEMPISEALAALPIFQRIVSEHHGIVDRVQFGHSMGPRSGTKTTLTLDVTFFGSAPRPGSPFKQRLTRLQSVDELTKSPSGPANGSPGLALPRR